MAAFALKKVAYIRLESVADFIGIRNSGREVCWVKKRADEATFGM